MHIFQEGISPLMREKAFLFNRYFVSIKSGRSIFLITIDHYE